MRKTIRVRISEDGKSGVELNEAYPERDLSGKITPGFTEGISEYNRISNNPRKFTVINNCRPISEICDTSVCIDIHPNEVYLADVVDEDTVTLLDNLSEAELYPIQDDTWMSRWWNADKTFSIDLSEGQQIHRKCGSICEKMEIDLDIPCHSVYECTLCNVKFICDSEQTVVL